MAIRKKKPTYKKKTGGSKLDSAAVSPKVAVVGLKKRTDNSTSYNKTNNYKKQPVPSHPYGQPHKKVVGPVKKGTANKLK